MERWVGQNLTTLRAPGLRRTLLAFLAFAYLFVGLAHTISHTGEVVTSTISLDFGTASDDDPDDGGSKKSPAVAEHCSVCTPLLMPALVPDSGPSARPIKLSFVAPRLLPEDRPGLDTPPPKHLT